VSRNIFTFCFSFTRSTLAYGQHHNSFSNWTFPIKATAMVIKTFLTFLFRQCQDEPVCQISAPKVVLLKDIALTDTQKHTPNQLLSIRTAVWFVDRGNVRKLESFRLIHAITYFYNSSSFSSAFWLRADIVVVAEFLVFTFFCELWHMTWFFELDLDTVAR